MSEKQAVRPVEEIRFGRIRGAIWANNTQNGTRYNVTVSRLYRDGNDWKDSNSFGRDDLPIVAKVIDLCHTWIFTAGSGSEDSPHREPASARVSE